MSHALGIFQKAQIKRVKVEQDGNLIELYLVNICFCVLHFGELPDITFYVENNLDGSSIDSADATAEVPDWLDLDRIRNPGDSITETITMDGAGPWQLQYPAVEDLTFDIIGKMWAIGKSGQVVPIEIVGSVLKLNEAAGNVIELQDFNGYIAVSGVVRVTYSLGGSMSYYTSTSQFISELYTVEQIINARWEYVALSEDIGVLGSGAIAIENNAKPPQPQTMEIISGAGCTVTTNVVNNLDAEQWEVRYCFSIMYTGTLLPIKIYIENTLGNNIYIGSADAQPDWLDLDRIRNPGDVVTEVVTFDGSGPWNLQFPYVGDLSANVVGRIWGELADGTVTANNNLWYYVTQSEEAANTLLLKENYVKLTGVVVMEYTIYGRMSYYSGMSIYAHSSYDINDITGAIWRYVALSQSEGVILQGNLSISPPALPDVDDPEGVKDWDLALSDRSADPSGADGLQMGTIDNVWGPIPAWTEG